jgi:hypothetical protein
MSRAGTDISFTAAFHFGAMSGESGYRVADCGNESIVRSSTWRIASIGGSAMTVETITAGRLLWGQVRDCLKQAKFLGMDIEWIESSGWVERDFTIKGKPEDVRLIVNGLMEAFKNLEQSR